MEMYYLSEASGKVTLYLFTCSSSAAKFCQGCVERQGERDYSKGYKWPEAAQG